MLTIKDNCLYLKDFSDFKQKTIQYFYKRLCMFLMVTPKKLPKLVWGNYDECSAYYDWDLNEIGFDYRKYNIKHEEFKFKHMHILEEAASQYRYLIPLSDIYHELIHKVQSDHVEYEFPQLEEASAELFSYWLTGQLNNEYYEESVALWNILKNYLKLDIYQIYVAVRNSIVDEQKFLALFYSNKSFIRNLGQNHNGDLDQFFNTLHQKYFNSDFESQFDKEMAHLHNLIFYNY